MQRSPSEPIGIIGVGVVGGALLRYFQERGTDARIYDPAKGFASASILDNTATIFVCVPTPYTPGRGFDDSYVHAAVSAIPAAKTVVIKSTVLPGTTELMQERYPQHQFLFNPEFLRETSAYDDLVVPDRQIVGCTDRSAGHASRIMSMLPRAPFERICSAGEAEMAKYVANSFLAVKVMYANEVFDLCERLKIDYGQVRDIAAADVRIGGSHMDVFDSGYRGYGGKCLPKDSKALLDLARAAGIEMAVLRATDRANEALRRSDAVDQPQLEPIALRLSFEERAA